MAWVNWNRKLPDEANRDKPLLGVDLNASRARASQGRTGHNRALALEDAHFDLPLTISLEKKVPEMGRAGLAIARKLPHLYCAGYLPFLGQAREWQAGRHRLSAQDALAIALEKIGALSGAYESISLALPSYLSLAQATRLTNLAAKERWVLNGTVVSSLALAADRAGRVLGDAPEGLPSSDDRVIPMHRPGHLLTGANVLIVDADEYALTGSLVRIERDRVLLKKTADWPKLGVKTWKDRMLDSLCDRCIRLCRRDPRDSAEADQEMYEQLDPAMDRIRAGQKVCLTIRAFHWYQDIEHQPSEFESYCAGLIQQAVDSIAELLQAAGGETLEAVWLTHDAGRLPGLAKAVHEHLPERSLVSVLQPDAVAVAAANLGERRKTGAVPRGSHLDTSIPIILPIGDATKVQAPITKVRR